MSGPVAAANRIGGQIAEALGLPKDRIVSLRLTAEVGEVIKVEAVIYPTPEQMQQMLALAKEARIEHPMAFTTRVEAYDRALRIVMEVLNGPAGDPRG